MHILILYISLRWWRTHSPALQLNKSAVKASFIPSNHRWEYLSLSGDSPRSTLDTTLAIDSPAKALHFSLAKPPDLICDFGWADLHPHLIIGRHFESPLFGSNFVTCSNWGRNTALSVAYIYLFVVSFYNHIAVKPSNLWHRYIILLILYIHNICCSTLIN